MKYVPVVLRFKKFPFFWKQGWSRNEEKKLKSKAGAKIKKIRIRNTDLEPPDFFKRRGNAQHPELGFANLSCG